MRSLTANYTEKTKNLRFCEYYLLESDDQHLETTFGRNRFNNSPFIEDFPKPGIESATILDSKKSYLLHTNELRSD